MKPRVHRCLLAAGRSRPEHVEPVRFPQNGSSGKLSDALPAADAA